MGTGIVGTGSYGLRDAEYASYVDLGAGSTAVRVEGQLSLGSVDIQVGAVEIKNSDTDTRVSVAYVDSAMGSGGMLVLDKAESTVPTEVADGDAVAKWVDTLGRQVIKGTNLGQECLDVSEIAPAVLQTINTVNLSAVGSSAGSNVGAWVNMSDFRLKTLYFNYTSGTTGGMNCLYEVSPDAGSTTFSLGSKVYTDTTTKDIVNVTDHYEYLRSRTTTNSGGTLTVTFTGRGA